MEGDMKDIVLQRLEQRLKEKDEELHDLKTQLAGPASAGDIQGLKDRLEALEAEMAETKITLSEVMKKVGALENALNSILMSMVDTGEGQDPSEDLSIPGSIPADDQPFDKFAADANQKDIKGDGESSTGNADDNLRFFHLSRNS
jgi:hypothetical protein